MSQTHASTSPSPPPTAIHSVARFGPAWIISAVACGPATMASVSMAGGLYGYQLLWVVVLSALFAFVAQYMAAKVGLIGQKGIVSIVEETWGKTLAWILTIDALAATWLSAAALMKALVGSTVLISGVQGWWWGPLYALLLFGLVGLGGYRALEMVCKILVTLVVVCFMITLAVVAPNFREIVGGLVPSFPGGAQGGLMMAGIMGGAVHITIIAMHTYNVNARGWTRNQTGLAKSDTFWSMFAAFGLYSTALFLAAAVVLHPKGTAVKSAFDLAQALKPVLGPYAGAVFMTGFYAAVLSTITPTFMAGGYLLADKLGWKTDARDNRFKFLVLIGCAISLSGLLVKGSFLVMLVIMLALGLCGTPFIIALMMLLLNKKEWAGAQKNGPVLNALGILTLAITTFLAIRFLVAKLG